MTVKNSILVHALAICATLSLGVEAFAAGTGPLTYYPLEPCTVVSNLFNTPATLDFDVTPEGGDFSGQGGSASGCGIPTAALAVQLSVKTVGKTGNGRILVYPQDEVSSRPIENFGITSKENSSLPVALCTDECTADLTLSVEANNAASSRVTIEALGYFLPPVESSSALIVGGGGAFNGSGTTANNFLPMASSGRTNDYDGSKTPVPLAGTLTDFTASLNDVAGIGGGYAFNVIKNGALAGITCTVAGDTDLSCTNASSCAEFGAGDEIAVQVTGVNATNRVHRWIGVFTPGGSCPVE